VANDQETILAAHASLDGKLEGSNITLEGRFKGDVKASGRVRILQGSDVDAKVEAQQVEIGGKFHGDVHAEILRLLGQARASGTFRAKRLSVEEGGQLEGDFEIGEGSAKSRS
jgi:cytoskeletal protein CcmA (bactofilin family)